jgi:hypothetical protein
MGLTSLLKQARKEIACGLTALALLAPVGCTSTKPRGNEAETTLARTSYGLTDDSVTYNNLIMLLPYNPNGANSTETKQFYVRPIIGDYIAKSSDKTEIEETLPIVLVDVNSSTSCINTDSRKIDVTSSGDTRDSISGYIPKKTSKRNLKFDIPGIPQIEIKRDTLTTKDAKTLEERYEVSERIPERVIEANKQTGTLAYSFFEIPKIQEKDEYPIWWVRKESRRKDQIGAELHITNPNPARSRTEVIKGCLRDSDIYILVPATITRPFNNYTGSAHN